MPDVREAGQNGHWLRSAECPESRRRRSVGAKARKGFKLVIERDPIAASGPKLNPLERERLGNRAALNTVQIAEVLGQRLLPNGLIQPGRIAP